jgi:hypothetical protein
MGSPGGSFIALLRQSDGVPELPAKSAALPSCEHRVSQHNRSTSVSGHHQSADDPQPAQWSGSTSTRALCAEIGGTLNLTPTNTETAGHGLRGQQRRLDCSSSESVKAELELAARLDQLLGLSILGGWFWRTPGAALAPRCGRGAHRPREPAERVDTPSENILGWTCPPQTFLMRFQPS